MFSFQEFFFYFVGEVMKIKKMARACSFVSCQGEVFADLLASLLSDTWRDGTGPPAHPGG